MSPEHTLNGDEIAALQRVVRLAWAGRERIALSRADENLILIAIIAVGTETEGEAAAELLRARRLEEAKQRLFDLAIDHDRKGDGR